MAVENIQKPPLWQGLEMLVGDSPRALLLLAGGIVVSIVLSWHVFETRWYRAAVPAEIGLTFGFATTGSDSRFSDLLSIAPSGACGGAIFKLTDASATAISERGLDFLKNARQGRGHTDKLDRRFHYYSYLPWQTTPLPSEWTSKGPWWGLNCMGLQNIALRNIMDAAQKTGSFYTTGESKMLLVVPSLQKAILTHTH